MLKKIALILSGCGHQDGAEITESVSALIALSELKVEVQIFAPDREFATAHSPPETRNVLAEAGRIARGQIRALRELQANQLAGVVLPGGYGVAKNLCNWAEKGAACEVLPEVQKVIQDFYRAQKPIAAICIAPALVAKILGNHGITVTIGNDPETAAEIVKTGAVHEICSVDDFVTDRAHRVVSTPAYMFSDAQPFEVFTGIRKALREFKEMA